MQRKTRYSPRNDKAPFAIYEAPFRYPTNEDLLVIFMILIFIEDVKAETKK